MTTTWSDLSDSIHDTGAIDETLVRDLIEARARSEFRAWTAAGLARSFDVVRAEAETMVRTRAATILDNEIANRLRAALPASEQWARTAELAAELAEISIPPRHEEAAALRAKAARLRALVPFTLAAE